MKMGSISLTVLENSVSTPWFMWVTRNTVYFLCFLNLHLSFDKGGLRKGQSFLPIRKDVHVGKNIVSFKYIIISRSFPV